MLTAPGVAKLLEEPLLKQLSPRPSPFVRGLVACVGTDYCNLALIETKSRAIALSEALHNKLGSGVNPLHDSLVRLSGRLWQPSSCRRRPPRFQSKN